MIYTITLSPSLDRTIDVEEFAYDDVNMILEEKRRASGRGINVSRVIRALAGIVFALSERAAFRGALTFGVACGTASTLTADAALCSKADVETIKRDVSTRDA